MRAVIQRVAHASVAVDGNVVGKIKNGFMVLLGITKNDTEKECKLLSDKIAKLRVFTDENDKMNLSLLDFADKLEPYSMLVISQFTLCANTSHGNRPDFLEAARPETAKPLYERFVQNLKSDYGICVETGIFGADMQVSLLNDGPVTIIIDTDNLKKQ